VPELQNGKNMQSQELHPAKVIPFMGNLYGLQKCSPHAIKKSK